MSLKQIRQLSHAGIRERRRHRHELGQLFTIQSGVVAIEAEGGRWVMPTGCIAWIPPGMMHGASVQAGMTGTGLYFDGAWSRAAMPDTVKVARLSPLLDALLAALTGDAAPTGTALEHYLAVFADAFAREPAQTLFLPMPREPRLARMAARMVAAPDDNTDLDGWAARIGMSRRTLTRRFQAETGWTIVQWRQQMRLLAAMERLAAGHSVTAIAIDLGYASVSSFIAMFRRYLGTTPRAYMPADGAARSRPLR
ncbi:helix-turn-helix transcriptional regulator [Cupriavidus gilardii]|uniref:AraC family transcriptional regulator n=1 Tax=Cupriavidus gilardii TaxID=82541 RepID=UPI0021C1299F|nr:helix-turn-helix transcriptional regulator [Cupriavidus gilardii]